ncbi:hypothetical protein EAW94_21865 [Salmonella enterica]|nr:hypothetical protein [Salmonella enterica]
MEISFHLELAYKYGWQDFIRWEYWVDKRAPRVWLRSLLLLPDSVVIPKKNKDTDRSGSGRLYLLGRLRASGYSGVLPRG